jgi:predicted metal-dependent HD superfamily phosphohydrolase
MSHADQSLVFQTIAKYSEPWRRFHTMEHLAYLWLQYERAAALNPNLNAYRTEMELLIPFHDWVYVPGSKTNEIESAEFASAWLTTFRPECGGMTRSIPRIILGTQHHQSPRDHFESLFFDMDLSGLGDTPEAYAKTSTQVREEFVPFVGLSAYRVGRADWLRGMLKRPVLFHTPEFQKFEIPARINMEAEIMELTGGKE